MFNQNNITRGDTKSQLNHNPDKGINNIEKKNDIVMIPGLSGLQNIGNTCYFNAAIQALSNTIYFNIWMREKKFVSRLKKNSFQAYIKKKNNNKNNISNIPMQISNKELTELCQETIIWSLSELFITMWRENCLVTPNKLKRLVGKINNQFLGYSQNDSQELLNTILDQIHEETKTSVTVHLRNMPEDVVLFLKYKEKLIELVNDKSISNNNKKKNIDEFKKFKINNPDIITIYKAYNYWQNYIENNHSIITDLFTGLFYSKIECKVCGKRSDTFEPFTNLQIETQNSGNSTLQDSLKHFSFQEQLYGDNQYNCSLCNKKTDAEKTLYIWEPPEILIIQLKRFKNEIINYGSIQRTQQIKTNSIIDFPLNDLKLTDNLSKLHKLNNCAYDLYAVTEHTGSCHGGHYISYCKNPINNLWYKFNDSSVSHIPDKDIAKTIITNNAYILYYQKK